MANANLTHSDVMSICDKLECSPSQHSKVHPMNPPNVHVASQGLRAHAEGRTPATGEFKKERRSGKIVGYSSRNAKGATQE